MMKNRKYSIFLVVVIFSFIGLFVIRTTAFFNVSALGEEHRLQLTEWQPAVSTVKAIRGEKEYSLEEKADSNLLEQSLVLSDNYLLSFKYRVTSSEDLLGFDTPNFIVKLNGKVVYQDRAKLGAWNFGVVDLSEFEDLENECLVEFLANNTFDQEKQPSLEMSEVSTAKFLAKQGDLLKFSLSKDSAELHIKYQVLEDGLVTQKQDILQTPYEFIVDNEFVNDTLEYFSVDEFGNVEDSKFIKLATDFVAPESLVIKQVFGEGNGEVSVVFSNSGLLLKSYDFRMSDESLNDSNWEVAKKVELLGFQQFINSKLPLQFTASSSELEKQGSVLLKTDLRGSKYLGARVMDLAGNLSTISESVVADVQ